MATSSITKNFVISGKEQVEMFVNAIEESAKNRPVPIPIAADEITHGAGRVFHSRIKTFDSKGENSKQYGKKKAAPH